MALQDVTDRPDVVALTLLYVHGGRVPLFVSDFVPLALSIFMSLWVVFLSQSRHTRMSLVALARH